MVQAPQSSTFSRKIVNLFAGMAFGSPDLPRILRDAGYVCHSIEPSFAVAPQKLVNPEIVLCSESNRHTLIVEAKSGANLKTSQLERYALISADSLVKQAFTTADAARSHDVLLVGMEQHTERLLMGTALVPSIYRVLSVVVGLEETRTTKNSEGEASQPTDEVSYGLSKAEVTPQGIKRVENDFTIDQLNDAFDPLLALNWDLVPNAFLPVDHESVDWEFAELIFPEIIAAVLNGSTLVRVDELAKTFIRNWDFIAAAYKRQLLDRIRYVIVVAAQRRFSPYITFGESGSSKNEVKIKPQEKLNESPSTIRTQLQRRFRELMEDLNSPQIAMIYGD
jgi:hypothetical protein